MVSFNLAVFLSLFVTTNILPGAHGFLQPAPATRPSALFASRREVVGVGFLSAAVVGTQPAIAEEGSIVELQVANLDGVEGRTGTIKIQLRPDWAPRGVQRFEVREEKDLTVYVAIVYLYV
jgi:hypothetical protein